MRFELAFPFRVAELAKAVGAPPPKNADRIITALTTDSRLLHRGDLFVALRGLRTDGHAFIECALRAGAAAVLSEKDTPGAILVPDTVEALRRFASFLLERNRIPVIAVTGSVGKTGTKDAVAAALSSKFRVHKTAENQNNELGVSFSVFSRPRDAELLVLEFGTNHRGEIAAHSAAIRPDLGIITTIGKAHIGAFGTQDAIFREKTDIISGMRGGHLITNCDDPYLSVWNPPLPVLRIGLCAAADFRAEEISTSFAGTSYTLTSGEKRERISLQSLGRPAIYASLFALAAARHFGVPTSLAARAIADLKGAKGRQAIVNAGGITLIDDSYNASPESVAEALSLLKSLTPKERCHIVLGDMLELGEETVPLHEEVGRLAAKEGAYLYLFGNFAGAIARGAQDAGMPPSSILLFPDAEAVLPALLPRLSQTDTVLVKASHSLNGRRIVEGIKQNRTDSPS